MRKLFAAVLASAMILSLAACGQNGSQSGSSAGSNNAPGVSGSGSNNVSASQPVEGYTFSDTITITVPFNAGSNTDSQIRFIQPYLEKHLGVNTVIVNAGGASGVIGTTEFLTKAADGNNILFSLPTPTVYKPAGGETEYTVDDLIPVSQTSSSPFYLAVSAENKNFTDGASVLDYIKNNPGAFTYANAGNGGIAHLAFASFLHGEDLDALSVPFTGGTADCYTAVMGGHVMGHAVSEPDLVGRTDYNVLINLGTKSTAEGFANIPTLEELGYPGYATDTFAGFYYMKGVDSAIVEAFDAAVEATLNDPEFQAAAAEASFGYSYMDSAGFTAAVQNTAALAAPILESLA